MSTQQYVKPVLINLLFLVCFFPERMNCFSLVPGWESPPLDGQYN